MLTVNLAAIRHNVGVLKQRAGEAKLMAVVKNNAYGHGLIPVATAAAQAGAEWFAVQTVTEGLKLRDAGITEPILVLGLVNASEIPLAIDYKLDISVLLFEQLEAFRSAIPAGSRLRIHLKLETGLHRYGFREDELVRALPLLGLGGTQASSFALVGAYSHLAAVEEAQEEHTGMQLERFRSLLNMLRADTSHPLLRHLAATAAALRLPETHFDMVRAGIGLYGLWPSQETQERINASVDLLAPALEWHEEIVRIHTIEPGESVGYGCSWRASVQSRIAILAVGYADGVNRRRSNGGTVEVFGIPCPIVGRVCTNATFVDVTGVKQANVGDRVVLIAADHRSAASAERVAEQTGTIHYDVVTTLPAHLKREYLDA